MTNLTRPSIILIGKENGTLDVWDLFDNLGSPSHQHLVSAIGIKYLEMNKSSPKLLTVGDKDGCLHLLNLPNNLYTKNSNEKEYFLNFIEKEKKRVSYYHSKLTLLNEEKRKQQTLYNERDFYMDVRSFLG
jgi:hypothetical protein